MGRMGRMSERKKEEGRIKKQFPQSVCLSRGDAENAAWGEERENSRNRDIIVQFQATDGIRRGS
jgi:hypothetical protein